MLHQPYKEKVNAIHTLYASLQAFKDYPLQKNKIEEIKKYALSNNDKELFFEMDLFSAYQHTLTNPHSATQNIKDLEALISNAESMNIPHIEIRAMRVLAEYYWEVLKDYENAFEWYNLQDKKLAKIQADDYPDMARELLKIGQAFYFFQDYTQAKKYLFRAIKIPETAFNTMFVNSALNTLGLCYQKENNFDSSNYFLRKILKTNFAESKKVWGRIANGDIGANYFYCGDIDGAIPLLKYDYKGAFHDSDYFRIVASGLKLAHIYLQKAEWVVSGKYIDSVAKYISIGALQDELRFLFPLQSKWYAAKGNHKKAALYFDSTILAIYQYEQRYSGLKLVRAQQKISKHEASLRLTELALVKQKKRSERNLFFLIITALCFALITFYFVQKKKQFIKNFKLQKTANELDIARMKIVQFIENISEKNKLIEQLKSSKLSVNKSNLIQDLKKRTILTDEEWQKFQQLFEMAYPSFIEKVKTDFPELTMAELRYFVLTKLHLTYKEIASMLGVSPNTVQVLRHRIRKKMNLNDNSELDYLIAAI